MASSVPPATALAQGAVTLDGDELVIRFPFSKRRFEAAKRLGCARYCKETKGWHLPVRYLSKLEQSSAFGPDHISYRFDRNAALELAAIRLTSAEESRQRIEENPFCVLAEDLAKTEIDIVFRLNSRGDSLRAYPRYGSRIKKLLIDIKGVHYLKPEKAYFFPADRLNSFLKGLRQTKFSFAVEASAGERLKRTAALRARIIDGETAACAADLHDCLLTPLVDILGKDSAQQKDPSFCLRGYSTEQLRHCFPHVRSFAEKKLLAQTMGEAELMRLFSSVQRTSTRIYITHAVASFLDRRKSAYREQIASQPWGFDDTLLLLSLPPVCWTCGQGQKGSLLISQELLQKLGSAEPFFSRLQTEVHPQFPQHRSVIIRDSELAAFFAQAETMLKQNGVSPVPATSSFASLLDDIRLREKLIERQRSFRSLADCKLDLSDQSLEAKLFPHQRVAVAWLRETPQALLGDDMGLGKTLAVLTAYFQLRAEDKLDFLVVACPNSLTRNWLREAAKWLPSLRLVIPPDNKRGRVKCLASMEEDRHGQTDGLVLNYECLRLEYVHPLVSAICRKRRSLLCLDESQRAKNPASRTFAALRQIAPLCPHRILLSGTPTPRDISDIWAQMMVLDGGRRFGSNFYEWLASIAELGTKWSNYAVKRFRPDEVTEVTLRVQEVLLRRKKEEVIDLPEKLFSIRDVELSGSQKERFEEIRKDLLLRISSLSGEVFLRSIDNILEEYLRAVQAASNPRLIDPQWKGEPAKFLELDAIVEEMVDEQRQKIVIWTNYRLNVDELVLRYARHGARAFTGDTPAEERMRVVEDFQSQEPSSGKVLVAIPAAGGVGITLTAAQVAVYLDKTWNAEHWLQSIDRIHRIGQTGTVNIISLHASLVDELVAANLSKKERMLAGLLGDSQQIDAPDALPTKQELIEALNEK